MASASRQEITRLLVKWSEGDQAALSKLMPLVYTELRRLARHQLRRERCPIPSRAKRLLVSCLLT